MDEATKQIIELITIIAALITAVINTAVVFLRGKVDPSPLKVIREMSKDSAKTARKQADRIEGLSTAIATEMTTLSRSVNQATAKIDILSNRR